MLTTNVISAPRARNTNKSLVVLVEIFFTFILFRLVCNIKFVKRLISNLWFDVCSAVEYANVDQQKTIYQNE